MIYNEPHGPDTTLETAKIWLNSHLREGGICPCCHQRAQMYRRKIHDGLATFLVGLHRLNRYGETSAKVARVQEIMEVDFNVISDYANTRHWKLAQPAPGRPGEWMITELGVEFCQGMTAVPRYVWTYNKRRHGSSDEVVKIQEIIGDKFDLDELLGR